MVLTWWCFPLLGKQGTRWRMGQNLKLQAFVGEVEGEGAWASDSMTEGEKQRNLTKQGPMGGLHACVLSRYSRVQLFVTPWTVAHQAPLSMGFSRQEYWSGLPCPSPGDLPDPGIEPMSLMSPALADGFFTTSATWEAPISGLNCLLMRLLSRGKKLHPVPGLTSGLGSGYPGRVLIMLQGSPGILCEVGGWGGRERWFRWE